MPRFAVSRLILACAICALTASIAVSCHTIDDDRIPPAPVRIAFVTVGEWHKYGVGGALDTRRFIIQDRIPADYPYTALSYTGFGGVLLVGDIYGAPMAYDLACPVECRQDVRLFVNHELNIAECPVCHSTYDIFTNYGHPLSGPAAQRGYGLQRYHVGPGAQGEYMVITR